MAREGFIHSALARQLLSASSATHTLHRRRTVNTTQQSTGHTAQRTQLGPFIRRQRPAAVSAEAASGSLLDGRPGEDCSPHPAQAQAAQPVAPDTQTDQSPCRPQRPRHPAGAFAHPKTYVLYCRRGPGLVHARRRSRDSPEPWDGRDRAWQQEAPSAGRPLHRCHLLHLRHHYN